jgi:hypothetical protein
MSDDLSSLSTDELKRELGRRLSTEELRQELERRSSPRTPESGSAPVASASSETPALLTLVISFAIIGTFFYFTSPIWKAIFRIFAAFFLILWGIGGGFSS